MPRQAGVRKNGVRPHFPPAGQETGVRVDARPPAVEVLVGLIEDADGRVLVNRRRPGTHMAGFWEFPGGKRTAGETRLDALKRELDEELGITVLEAIPVLEVRHDYPDKSVALDVWRVLRYSGEPFAREGQELRWVETGALGEIGLLPADAPIVDALTASVPPSDEDRQPGR
ncbi:MAG TPA: 8-oxo-dGTP diphosphatase MutT [Gammaproteobacteria bacterium]|nr:8-oxo-dGTP diphosphatase MutT [Gammaproteobacteria bacterium]